MADRPDPDLMALACAKSLAQIWNAPTPALQQAVEQAIQPDPDLLGWMIARLRLQGLGRGAGRFPRAVPFPLAPMLEGHPGAIGFVRCSFTARETPAPAAMDAATQAILAWFGDRTKQSVTAHFDLPAGSDGGSAALAVVIASLLAREPELAPSFGSDDPEAHRFAATGTLANDARALRLAATHHRLPAKLATLHDYGYRTLFVVAAASTPAVEVPPGLELVEVPQDPVACVATLRRWFLAQLPLAARVRYRWRRHRLAIALATSLLLATAAMLAVVGVRNHIANGEQAVAHLAAAAMAAEQFDWTREHELVEAAYELRPDQVDAALRASAHERSSRIAISQPPTFAGIESSFCVVGAVVVGHTASEWVGWELATGDVRWRRPRASQPVVDVRPLGARVLGVLLDGNLCVMQPADGMVVSTHDLGFRVATVDCRGPLVLAAGEGKAVLWDSATDTTEALPTVPLTAGYDSVTFLATPARGAVVRSDGSATVFGWGEASTTQPRQLTCPIPSKPGSSDAVLKVHEGMVYVVREEATRLHAWDLETNQIRASYRAPSGGFSAIAAGSPKDPFVATLSATPSSPALLAQWSSNSPMEPPRQQVVPDAVGSATTLVRTKDNQLLVHTRLDLALVGSEPLTHNGRTPAMGTLVRLDFAQGVLPQRSPTLRPTSIAVHADGKQFVAGGDDGVLHWGTIEPLAWTRQVAVADASIVGCWWLQNDVLVLAADGRLLMLPAEARTAPTELTRLDFPPGIAAFDATSRLLVAAPSSAMLPTPAVPTQPWLRRHQPANDHFRVEELMYGTATVVDLRQPTVVQQRLTNLPDPLRCVAVSSRGALGFGSAKVVEIRAADAPQDSVGDRLHIATPARSMAFAPHGDGCAIGDIAGAVHFFFGTSWGNEPLLLLPAETGVEAALLAFSADGLQVAAHLRTQELGPGPSGRGIVQWWWLGTGAPVFHAACAPLGALVAATVDEQVGWLAVGWDRRVQRLR